MSHFQAPTVELFFSRNDPQDPRLGDLATQGTSAPTPASENERSVAIFGYPDDEGIRLNGGRPGAAEAPDRIRQFLYRMTPGFLSPELNQVRLQDRGNLKVSDLTLERRHEVVEAAVKTSLDEGFRALTFGGGHDYGFPDGAAFATYCHDKGIRPLVINFDAHLDVRPTNQDPSDRKLTSGTPFFRLLEKFPQTDFVEIGIQSHCNARAHFEWAKERGARILTHEEFLFSGEDFSVFVTRRLDDWLLRPRPVFLSIDIDGFSNAFAPGCSQSWATGFEPDSFLRLLQILLRRLDVRVFSLYEVSPPLDQDNRTAKLAALLAHRFLYPA